METTTPVLSPSPGREATVVEHPLKEKMDETNTNGAEVTACQMSRMKRNNYANMAQIHYMAIRGNLRPTVILIVLIVIKQVFNLFLSCKRQFYHANKFIFVYCLFKELARAKSEVSVSILTVKAIKFKLIT